MRKINQKGIKLNPLWSTIAEKKQRRAGDKKKNHKKNISNPYIIKEKKGTSIDG